MSTLVAGLAAVLGPAAGFAARVIGAVERQIDAGSMLALEEWGDAADGGGRVECGCALTLLVQDEVGVDEANDLLERVRDEDERETAAYIASLLDGDQTASQVFGFLCGFDDKTPDEDTDGCWVAAGRVVRQHFDYLWPDEDEDEAPPRFSLRASPEVSCDR